MATTRHFPVPRILTPRRGVGTYPDETCFDAQRPSWLPYWLDDFTESGCKANELLFGNPTGNTAQPGTFQNVVQSDGTTVAVPAASPAAVLNAQAQCANIGGTWNAALQSCTPGLASTFSGFIPWVVSGLALLFLLKGGRR